MIRHSDDRRILLCLRADVYNAEAPFIHAIAHRIFHKRLQDKRGQDAIQLLLNIKFHSQLFFKAGLLQTGCRRKNKGPAQPGGKTGRRAADTTMKEDRE